MPVPVSEVLEKGLDIGSLRSVVAAQLSRFCGNNDASWMPRELLD
jgi:hypothetical protein